MTDLVRVDGVTKYFEPRRPRPSWLRDLRTRSRQVDGRPRRTMALQDVSIEVAAGEAVALLGANGAGKTTLLRLIAGVGRPDEGVITLSGRIGALLELGAGTHPDLTGRENAQLSMVVAGFTRRDARRRLAEVAEFAEVAAVFDDPLRTYSSGMRARLAFSVSVHVDADILLVDEVLAVGDLSFQQRCRERISTLQRTGVGLLLVSHDPALAVSLCTRAVWLRRGRVMLTGPADTIAEGYAQAVAAETAAATPSDLAGEVTETGTVLLPHVNRSGSLRVRVGDVRICDLSGRPIAEIAPAGALRVSLSVTSPATILKVNVNVVIVREDGVRCVEAVCEVDVSGARGHEELTIERLDLAPGRYTVDVGVHDMRWEETYDYHHGAYPLTVSGPRSGTGVLSPPLMWRDDGAASRRDAWLLRSSTSS